MCPSCPQACIAPGCSDSNSTPLSSWIGSASMSARSATTGLPPPRRASTLVSVGPLDRQAEALQRARHERRRLVLGEADLGVAVQVAPPGHDVLVDPCHRPTLVVVDSWRSERARPQQRPRLRAARRAGDGLRARLRLRPEHVALRRARVRGRPSRGAVRPRRRRRVGPDARTTPSATARSTATPTTSWRSAASSTSPASVFVGHSVSAMIGVLAAARAPDRIGKLVLVGPSPRYIDDEGYTGGFTQADIEELLESMNSQLPRLVERDGAGDHGQPGPARARRRADRELLPHRPGDRRAASRA